MPKRSTEHPGPAVAPDANELTSLSREQLIALLGSEVVRFQDLSNQVDAAAAAVLALERQDLTCLSVLLFGGPAPLAQLAAMLDLTASGLRSLRERLELAGYARRVPSPTGELLELTEHARTWIETLWGPLQQEGVQLLTQQTRRDLLLLARFMQTTCAIQESHAARINGLLRAPAQRGPKNRRRGGLSPASLRRVQLFVEANLARTVPLRELAERAGLSAFHFARAFKASMGMTPRSFVESRRIERARLMLREGELPLSEVALACGFGSQSRFTTTFRRATSLTPAVYRSARDEGH